MSQRLASVVGGTYIPFLASTTITTAVSATAGTVFPAAPSKLPQVKYLNAQCVFSYGSGGTSVDVYVQTSLDQGATWVDIMEFNFLLATATKISAVVFTTALAAGVA